MSRAADDYLRFLEAVRTGGMPGVDAGKQFVQVIGEAGDHASRRLQEMPGSEPRGISRADRDGLQAAQGQLLLDHLRHRPNPSQSPHLASADAPSSDAVERARRRWPALNRKISNAERFMTFSPTIAAMTARQGSVKKVIGKRSDP
jgi:hypothetical protein